MTELARIKTEKNFTIAKIANMTGYSTRMIDYMLSGHNNTPVEVLQAVQLEPAEETDKITAGDFVATLEELKLTSRQAATILVKHADRLDKMTGGNMDRRVAITKADIEKLRKAGKCAS